jgi:DNA-binding protein HU-beta
MAITYIQFCNEFGEKLDECGFEGLTKVDVKVIVEAFGETIHESIVRQSRKKGERVVIPVRGLARWTVQDRPARMGRNPSTGETIKIKASKKLKVQADKAIADALGIKR